MVIRLIVRGIELSEKDKADILSRKAAGLLRLHRSEFMVAP